MSADLLAFVDTNVLVYAVSHDEPDKQRTAREIVARGFNEGCYAISTQVMFELYVNVTKKARIASSPTSLSRTRVTILGRGSSGQSRRCPASDRTIP